MIKKAFILAAGMGTRLGKLTEDRPKALIKINGVPMLQLVMENLIKSGIEEFMINIHHHGHQIIDFLDRNKDFNVKVALSDEQDELLDTGGALLKARHFFSGDEPVLVHNVDILSNIDLVSFLNFHIQQKAMATLCVRKRQSGRALLFDNNMILAGWKNLETCQYKWVINPVKKYLQLPYSGIYLADPGFVLNLPFTGNFSIVDAWLEMGNSQRIAGYLDTTTGWFDLGTSEKILDAENYLKNINLD